MRHGHTCDLFSHAPFYSAERALDLTVSLVPTHPIPATPKLLPILKAKIPSVCNLHFFASPFTGTSLHALSLRLRMS